MTMTEMEVEARNRVFQGARVLDRIRPGWHDQIDVGTFNIGEMCHCIVGQLWGGHGEKYPAICDGYPAQWVVRLMGKCGCASCMWAAVSVAVWRLPLGASYRATMVYYGFDWQKANMNAETLQDAWMDAIADRRLSGLKVEEINDELELMIGV